MKKNKTLVNAIKSKLYKESLAIYSISFAICILFAFASAYSYKIKNLRDSLENSSTLLSKAFSAGDWDMIISLANNLNVNQGIYNLQISSIGNIQSKNVYGFFPICIETLGEDAFTKKISGCINLIGNYDLKIFLILLLAIFIVCFFQYKSLENISAFISNAFLKLIAIAENSLNELSISNSTVLDYEEINGLHESINKSITNTSRLNSKLIIADIATQLSHDIRSPLAALEMISGSLNELPEDKRLIIRNSINRIRDISNSLLDKNRITKKSTEINQQENISSNEVEPLSVTLLSPLIDSIITEKRLQYRNQIGISINFNQTKESYGLFANIQPHEFQRVLSNLIDNSVEAFAHQQGTIELTLLTNKLNQIELIVKDNGKGISTSILPKLGNRGETHGKENGTGLGLFHAKETMQVSNGSLKIDSKLNHGTAITLTLPLEKSPSWFVPKISLKPNQTLIIFDDDQSIHQIWKGRLESLPNHRSISLRHFSDPNELRKFYGKNFTDLDDALFLMDYEISGSPESGLDVIDALGIQNQSILVTSRYEEKEIRQRCEKLGVKLIPKNMSGFVPIEISYSSS